MSASSSSNEFYHKHLLDIGSVPEQLHGCVKVLTI